MLKLAKFHQIPLKLLKFRNFALFHLFRVFSAPAHFRCGTVIPLEEVGILGAGRVRRAAGPRRPLRQGIPLRKIPFPFPFSLVPFQRVQAGIPPPSLQSRGRFNLTSLTSLVSLTSHSKCSGMCDPRQRQSRSHRFRGGGGPPEACAGAPLPPGLYIYVL